MIFSFVAAWPQATSISVLRASAFQRSERMLKGRGLKWRDVLSRSCLAGTVPGLQGWAELLGGELSWYLQPAPCLDVPRGGQRKCMCSRQFRGVSAGKLGGFSGILDVDKHPDDLINIGHLCRAAGALHRRFPGLPPPIGNSCSMNISVAACEA